MQASLHMPPRLLSSTLTPALRIVPILLWLADAGLLVWLGRSHALDVLDGPVSQGAIVRLAWIVAAAPIVLLPPIVWWGWRLKRVATDGASLFISAGRRTEAVPLADVAVVAEVRSRDLRTVTLRLEVITRWGWVIRFLAPTGSGIARGEPHPVVVELQRLVDAARPFSR
jgi:hypothetical protein